MYTPYWPIAILIQNSTLGFDSHFNIWIIISSSTSVCPSTANVACVRKIFLKIVAWNIVSHHFMFHEQKKHLNVIFVQRRHVSTIYEKKCSFALILTSKFILSKILSECSLVFKVCSHTNGQLYMYKVQTEVSIMKEICI